MEITIALKDIENQNEEHNTFKKYYSYILENRLVKFILEIFDILSNMVLTSVRCASACAILGFISFIPALIIWLICSCPMNDKYLCDDK